MVVIVDYGAGNLRSVARAVARLGVQATVSDQPEDVARAGKVILPGVGAAGDTMRSLGRLGLLEPIAEAIAADRPFLGICLGLQILLTASEEGGHEPCMGLIPGMVRHLPQGLKVPQIGWNQVRQRAPHPLFAGIPDNANFYFVHSYYVGPEDQSLVVGETEYGITFGSILARGRMVATQFHPEKSGRWGLRMLDNFLRDSQCWSFRP